jgi:hypothetical protein
LVGVFVDALALVGGSLGGGVVALVGALGGVDGG